MNNIQLVKSYYEALSNRNVKQAVSLFSTTGEFKDMSSLEVMRGSVELEKMFSSWIKAFPNMKVQIQNIFGTGDQVVCEGILTGTHTGPMLMPEGEIKPTGKSVNIPYCEIFKVGNNKINHLSCYMETAKFFQQLGIEPPVKATKAAA